MPRGTSARGDTVRRNGARSGGHQAPLARLDTPLVRDGGVLRPASWDDALDRAASGLRAATQQHGAGGVGMFSCSKSTNEMNYAAQKFMRTVLKSNNIDSCNRT